MQQMGKLLFCNKKKKKEKNEEKRKKKKGINKK